jgi:hypothetical protein
MSCHSRRIRPANGSGRRGSTPCRRRLSAGRKQLGTLFIECPAIDEVFQLPLTAHGEVPFSSITPGTKGTLRHEVRQFPVSYFAAGDTDASGAAAHKREVATGGYTLREAGTRSVRQKDFNYPERTWYYRLAEPGSQLAGCSWQLLQPGAGEHVPRGSGRRVCLYQVH